MDEREQKALRLIELKRQKDERIREAMQYQEKEREKLMRPQQSLSSLGLDEPRRVASKPNANQFLKKKSGTMACQKVGGKPLNSKPKRNDEDYNTNQCNKRYLEIDDGLLSCQICMLKYDRTARAPLCLRCGHTLCEKCAHSLIKYGRIKCPFDNQTFDHVNVELLGRNFTLLDLIDAERSEIKLNPDQKQCQRHPNKQIKFYCEDHKELICSECLLDNHLGHKMLPAKPLILGEVTSEILAKLHAETEKVKDQVTTHWEDSMSKYKISNSEIEAGSKALIEEIQRLTTRMMKDNDEEATRIAEEQSQLIEEIQDKQQEVGMMLFEIKSNNNMATPEQNFEASKMKAYIKNGLVNTSKMENDMTSIKTYQQFLEKVKSSAEQMKFVSPLKALKKQEYEEEKKASEVDLNNDIDTYQTQITSLKDLGFHDLPHMVQALKSTDGSVEQAIEYLFSNQGSENQEKKEDQVLLDPSEDQYEFREELNSFRKTFAEIVSNFKADTKEELITPKKELNITNLSSISSDLNRIDKVLLEAKQEQLKLTASRLLLQRAISDQQQQNQLAPQ